MTEPREITLIVLNPCRTDLFTPRLGHHPFCSVHESDSEPIPSPTTIDSWLSVESLRCNRSDNFVIIDTTGEENGFPRGGEITVRQDLLLAMLRAPAEALAQLPSGWNLELHICYEYNVQQ